MAVVITFICFGAEIRNMLSPVVIYDSPKSLFYEGSIYFVLPEETYIEENDGHTYIWRVIPSDKYREESYAVEWYEIDVITVNSQRCIQSDADVARILIGSSYHLENGMRVNCRKRG